MCGNGLMEGGCSSEEEVNRMKDQQVGKVAESAKYTKMKTLNPDEGEPEPSEGQRAPLGLHEVPPCQVALPHHSITLVSSSWFWSRSLTPCRHTKVAGLTPLPRVQEKNNCPLRFHLGLNLSTRLHKSNFDYFATKCYGQLSIQWTIVHTMSISWTIVHEMDNCYTIVHIVGNVHS